MKKKTIAVHIQSEVMFYSLEPLLVAFKKMPYKVVILIEEHSDDNEGWKEMSAGTIKLMKKHGFQPKHTEDFKDTIFDLCLTPYMDGLIRAKCYLKYDYGSLNTKPVLTYIPAALDGFHGFLSTGVDSLNYMSVYGKTFPVDNLRFLGKKRKENKGEKKIILFAPTYNDEYDVSENEEIIRRLKKHYYVIVKAHHGINYLKRNDKKKQSLQSGADEYYGSEVDLIDLMMRADVCLSGNSSTIGDAVRAGVPCVVYAHDLDCFRWKDFHTTQYELYKDGWLLACDKVEEVEKMISLALGSEYRKRWSKLADIMFPETFRTGVEGYLKVINYFLNDPAAKKYVLLYDYVNEMRLEEIRKKDVDIKELQRGMMVQQEAIEYYRKRRLYKFVNKMYGLREKVAHLLKRGF